MNYSLISQSNYFIDNLLDVVMRNRGIKCPDKIKNPSAKDVIHYSKLKNIDKLISVFDVYVQRESSELGIIVDSDCD